MLLPPQGRWGHRRVVRAFGPGILRSDGTIDREALAALIFAQPSARRRLDAATHPAVGLEIAARVLGGWLRCRTTLVVDMPLLFESGFHRLTAPRVLVACSADIQLRRLLARDALERAAAEARTAAQMPLAAKRRLADVTLENDGGLAELEQQVDALVAQLRRRQWLHRLLSPLGVAAAAALALLWRASV